MFKEFYLKLLAIPLCLMVSCKSISQKPESKFNIVAFYTAQNDLAHISFVNEANKWFKKQAVGKGFNYVATKDWSNMNDEFLQQFQVVVFLDTRPEEENQRKAFEKYMKNGGGWIGFHFSAFALDHSTYPNNWDWYQNEFLGCGSYKSNTWRPTSAILKIEKKDHPITFQMAEKLQSSPNEWYRWERDLRKNKNIEILLSIDPESFPLGTGPKPNEIWYEGYYPVVWTNKKYKMVYLNMGHNDMDYENGTNKELSFTFDNEDQNILILNILNWMGL